MAFLGMENIDKLFCFSSDDVYDLVKNMCEMFCCLKSKSLCIVLLEWALFEIPCLVSRLHHLFSCRRNHQIGIIVLPASCFLSPCLHFLSRPTCSVLRFLVCPRPRNLCHDSSCSPPSRCIQPANLARPDRDSWFV